MLGVDPQTERNQSRGILQRSVPCKYPLPPQGLTTSTQLIASGFIYITKTVTGSVSNYIFSCRLYLGSFTSPCVSWGNSELCPSKISLLFLHDPLINESLWPLVHPNECVKKNQAEARSGVCYSGINLCQEDLRGAVMFFSLTPRSPRCTSIEITTKQAQNYLRFNKDHYKTDTKPSAQ